MRFVGLWTVLILVAACSEGSSQSDAPPISVREFGVCIDLPSDRYTMTTSQMADFYMIEIGDAATQEPAARVYIGYSPDIDVDLLSGIEQDRVESAARSPIRVADRNSYSGIQYLGVPSDVNSAYYHVMFSRTTERQRSTVLRAITFCE
jgi:hypothetical protein